MKKWPKSQTDNQTIQNIKKYEDHYPSKTVQKKKKSLLESPSDWFNLLLIEQRWDWGLLTQHNALERIQNCPQSLKSQCLT